VRGGQGSDLVIGSNDGDFRVERIGQCPSSYLGSNAPRISQGDGESGNAPSPSRGGPLRLLRLLRPSYDLISTYVDFRSPSR